MKVLSVIGTRPEAIKMAPVVRELARRGDEITSVVCVTGQQREMLDQVLASFEIRPNHDLNVMRPNQLLSDLTSILFSGLDPVVRELKPDWVLAQGDTTTVLVASMVAFYNRARFGHVEAGLRTGDKHHPFPEEVNRRVADVVADAFFAPTERARQALLLEGAAPEKVIVSGNTVVDALLAIAARPFDWASSPFAILGGDASLVLVTAHRRESFGEAFEAMCLALRDLAARFTDKHFVYPVHLNPNVRQPVRKILSGIANFHLIEPVDYLTMVQLMKRACLILTDSGGVQEEAPSFGVPVLVMRETTERPEGVEAGVVKLVGTQRDRIVTEASKVLAMPSRGGDCKRGPNPYGDGKAAPRIVDFLLRTSGGPCPRGCTQHAT
jgi:UDP-N-acetylglucosamine 2-epimerase (non-hydrolysing)